MRRILPTIIIILMFAIPVSASEFEAPTVPYSAQQYFPEDAETFSEGLLYILGAVLKSLRPNVSNAIRSCIRLIAVTILLSIPESIKGGKWYTELLGVLLVSILLLGSSEDLLKQTISSITELFEYGKLLLPVMTGALAAQGAVSSATALCTGSMVFISILSVLLHTLMFPAVYAYLALSIGTRALGNDMLGQLQGIAKWVITWILKIVLYIFTGYLSITGVVSGSVDAQTMKAAKIAISGIVPVIGNILSDASEAVLISAGLMKNAAGLYGLLAIIAVGIGPFVQVGIQCICLKISSGVCSIFSSGSYVKLIKDFSVCMGFLLAMTATVTILLLICTVCFMKGGT